MKNKVAAPFREVEVDILYGEGISRESDLLDLGVIHELVEKSGSWFSYSGERIGQGRENARTYLVANPAAREQLNSDLRRKLGFDVPSPDEAAPKQPAAGSSRSARPPKVPEFGPPRARMPSKARFMGYWGDGS